MSTVARLPVHQTKLNVVSRSIGGLRRREALAKSVNEQLVREGYTREILEQRFLTQGKSTGRPWKPLTPGTILARARLGFSAGPILKRSGTLMRAVVDSSIRVGPRTIRVKMKDGPAPTYLGRGSIKRTPKRGQVASSGGKKLSDYAEALNEVRPFMSKFTGRELTKARRRRSQLVKQYLRRTLKGR